MVMTIGTLVFYALAFIILLIFTYVVIKINDPILIAWAVVAWAIVVVLPIVIHFGVIEWIDSIMNIRVW